MFEKREKDSSPRKYPIDAFERTIVANAGVENELIQFTDASTGMLRRIKGQRLNWLAKHTNPESSNNCTILTMSDGVRVAIGDGIMTTLPTLDRETGDFDAIAPRSTIEVSQMAPDGLPDAIIGEQWPLLATHGTLESALVWYKTFGPETMDHQVDMPSHLMSAMDLLRDSAAELSEDELVIREPRLR